MHSLQFEKKKRHKESFTFEIISYTLDNYIYLDSHKQEELIKVYATCICLAFYNDYANLMCSACILYNSYSQSILCMNMCKQI